MDDPFWRMAPARDDQAAALEDIEVHSIRLDCLWCDQGMAHVLEIVPTTSASPAALCVFDFGAEQMFKSSILREAQAAPAVDFLLRKLKELPSPRIEYFVISHQDTDHWSLVKYFLDEIVKQGIPLKVGKLYYGGADWGPGAKEQMRRLGTYAEVVAPQTVRFSDFDVANATPTQLGKIGDVTIHTLMVNAPVASRSASIRKNGTSAVIVIKLGGWRMILPGDATWETLHAANATLAKWTNSPIKPCWALSVPHHGSLATIVPDSSAAVLDFAATEQFVNYCEARSTVASAGIENSFKHPYLSVLTKFSASTWSSGYRHGPHRIVAYVPEQGDWAPSTPLTQNVYTTVLTHSVTPIVVANWYFAVSAEGDSITFVDTFNGVTKTTLGIEDYEDMETEEDKWWDDDDLEVELLALRSGVSPIMLQRPTPTARLVAFEKLGQPPPPALPLPPPAPRPAQQNPRPTRVFAPPPPKAANGGKG